MIKKILYISPDFNYSCGRSKLVFLYLEYFGNREGYETHFITNGGDSLERLNEIPTLKFQKLAFSSGIKNIFYQRGFYKTLKDYIIKNGINLIHTHHRFPEFVSNRIAKELNLKTLTSAHSFVTGFKKISFKSDKIISVSNSVTSYLVKNFNVNKKKIITLYNPVEEFPVLKPQEKEKLKREMGIKPDQKVLLFMGRINYIKGFDKLIEAYKIVHRKDGNAILIMCGKAEDKSFFELRTRLTVPIIIIPPLKDNKKLYQIAQIVVLPSRVETFSFVMIEAGSNKKPFIGGNTGGIAEFIEDGVDGLLVDPENENELAEKILFLLNNKETAEEFGNNLYKKVKEKCGYNNYFSRLEEIYNSLLNA
ncbi:MAG: glycosyltransferase family 4 protein [Ignavibacteria bacterium]|nr:glycosyltransferase family 4 protein [Ignavibacteria bacterium]